ncbi:TauD/TfdA dioxygenase family protein [Candidatus Poriferisodalis sp.]|uniref:TauD/TfdA dioxygenase family protein n=1 Tax=Candidatus Poriferisodalis sp. TaxID=3101277 RepID=UPI003C6F5735
MPTFEPIHPDFGARITGIDLTSELDDTAVAELNEAIDTYSLLHFGGQEMSDEAQLALTGRLGEPEPNHVRFGKTGEIDFFGTIGNVIDAETKRDESDPLTHNQKGNNMWHSDSSFRLVPSYVSILCAYEVPGEGGETLYTSQRAAYQRLSPQHQAEIDNLQVLHDYVFSRTKVAPVDPNHAASLPPIPHKLVRTNPANGLKNYYVGSHARSIIGWSGIDSRRLIDELNEAATRPQDVYTHRWSPGDTVIYDNRCLLHCGAGYDADRWRRYMRQTRVTGRGPTLDE